MKETLMIGGTPLAPSDTTVRPGVASAFAPLAYGHGLGGVGQLALNRLQPRGTSLWGVMASPTPILGMLPANVQGLAHHFIEAAAVVAKQTVIEISFGHVPLAVFDVAGQGAVTAALGGGCAPNGLFLFYLCLARPANKQIAVGNVIRSVVQGNETRFCSNGRANPTTSEAIIAVSQSHGHYVSNVKLAPPAIVPAMPDVAKVTMNKRDQQAIRLSSKLDYAAASFAEASAPVYQWISTNEPGLLLTKRGRDDIHSFLEVQWKRRRCKQTAYDMPRRAWRLPFWQRRVLYALLSMIPEKRRLFWIMSVPDAGKGTFGQYLGDADGWIADLFPNMVAQYPGVLNVTSYFTDGQRLAQMYDKAHVDDVPPGILLVESRRTRRHSQTTSKTDWSIWPMSGRIWLGHALAATAGS
jgi:hypothetical protein